MDTSVTSLITHSLGTLNNYSPLKHPHNNAIVVGNGHMIPVHGDVHTQLHPSLSLNNILCTPKLMKNLIYIKFQL